MGLSPGQVQVVYLSPEEQIVLDMELRADDRLEQLIRRSGLLERCPGLDLHAIRVGVFGEPRDLQDLAQPGDRIEVYRPLLADPKTARRQRAAKRARGAARPG